MSNSLFWIRDPVGYAVVGAFFACIAYYVALALWRVDRASRVAHAFGGAMVAGVMWPLTLCAMFAGAAVVLLWWGWRGFVRASVRISTGREG
jgi:hypothetical protein